jgi:hypothetical protein
MTPAVGSARSIRFSLEVVLSVVFGVAAGVTAIAPDWIEVAFHVDPDGGNGLLEWAVVAVLAALAVTAGWLARREHLRLAG